MHQWHQESMNTCIAHSSNEAGQPHGLVEHLRTVAEMAREFSKPFGGDEAAYYAGLWHDIGKFDPEFQRYLAGERPRGPDHKGAGTKLACQHLGPAGLIVQGHHGGLKAEAELKGWLTEKGKAPAALQSLETARQSILDLEPKSRVKIPGFVKDRGKAEFWVRMVFSAVVDADFLDTERHFNPGKSYIRNTGPNLENLEERFQERHGEATHGATGSVNEIRSEIYQACLDAAPSPTGAFSANGPDRRREDPLGHGLRPQARNRPRNETGNSCDSVHIHHPADCIRIPRIPRKKRGGPSSGPGTPLHGGAGRTG